ncbi:hypothetical protein ABIB17_003702 [Arthrobacter sp. UYEF6]
MKRASIVLIESSVGGTVVGVALGAASGWAALSEGLNQ